MNWYFTVLGGHTHVRVFMNGAKCGDLCFRNEEFQRVKNAMLGTTDSNLSIVFLHEPQELEITP